MATTSAGNRMCASASRQATQLPVSAVSSSRKPVIAVTGCAKLTSLSSRPLSGSQWSWLKKICCASSASAKTGAAAPRMAARPVARSNTPRSRAAASTPAGMPISSASAMPHSTSSSVAGRKMPRSVRTLRLVASDIPRSPCARLSR